MRILIKILFLLYTPFIFSEVSNYTLESTGPLSFNHVGLSDVAICETDDNLIDECYVDNNLRTLHYPGGYCYYGGDPEALAQYQIDKVYVVNEGAAGLAIIDLSLSDTAGGPCVWERRIKTGLNSGSSGIEGIEVTDNIVYLLMESGDLYYFIDDSLVENVTPIFLFNFANCDGCGGLGKMSNGNFIAITGPETSNGVILEYTQTGSYVDELPINLSNGEGVLYYNNQLIITGEPNHRSVYVTDSDPVDPEPDPVCTFEAGSTTVNQLTDSIRPVDVVLTCDDGVERAGVLQ